MVRRTALLCIALLAVLAACNGQGSKVSLQTFIGGNDGVIITFDENAPPNEVFDGGDFPFDIVVRLENKGEFFVPKGLAKVSITGVRPQEFNLQDADFKTNPEEDLIERKMDSEGNTINPGKIFVEFKNLNHVGFITGNALTFPFRAEICYLYGTTAATSLCVRKNLADPEKEGICDIEGNRDLSTSSAPVQVENVKEFRRGKDSVGFSFEVTHVGPVNGKIFNKGTSCEGGRSNEDRVLVSVKSDVPGLSCQGLSNTREGMVEGVIPLFDARRTVTCTQRIPQAADFELPLTIKLTYDYRDFAETEVVVKSSGEN